MYLYSKQHFRDENLNYFTSSNLMKHNKMNALTTKYTRFSLDTDLASFMWYHHLYLYKNPFLKFNYKSCYNQPVMKAPGLNRYFELLNDVFSTFS